ncbi:MAG: NTP transferase domain-containing protein [Spirochaetes bacterium]|nr:NTP transferase domain-containing protein [Spirochaetota bacterium]MBN2771200.1 NTP transferase domain-containing protein [Spirochaetota bacterium]
MRAIVLAAGKGVRMNSSLPKVLHRINNKPLVQHVIDSLNKVNVELVCVVVGYKADDVQNAIGDSVCYAFQKEQLGTGHAVLQAEPYFKDYSGLIIIACGDAPFVTAKSFKKLISVCSEEKCKAAVLTMICDDPYGYGRIIKDENDNVVGIVEEKDASDSIKQINEVNCGTYVVDSSLLFEGLKSVGTDNAQNEYYLPDIVKYITSKGYIVKSSVLSDNREGIGINSQKELEQAEKIYNEL